MQCSQCGHDNEASVRFCVHCGSGLQDPTGPRTSRLALAALVLAVLGPFGLGAPALLALVLAALALVSIRRSKGQLAGASVAWGAIVLSMLGLLLVGGAGMWLSQQVRAGRLHLVGKRVYRVSETPLLSLEEPLLVHGHWAGVAKEGGRPHVVLDGVPQSPWDKISSLTFNDDGTRLLYVAKKGKSEHLVVDGEAGPATPTVRDARFSRDGQHYCYLEDQPDGWAAVVDGQRVSSWRGWVEYLLLSDAGSHWGAVVGHYDREAGESTYETIVDGETKRSDVYVGDFCVSDRGGHWALVRSVTPSDGHYWSDDVPRGPWDIVRGALYCGAKELDLLKRPGSKVGLLWQMDKVGACAVVADGKKVGGDYGAITNLTYSASTQRLAFVAATDSGSRVVVDGKEGPSYQGIGRSGPVFSADGRHVAYAACSSAKWVAAEGQDDKDEFVKSYDVPALELTRVKFFKWGRLNEGLSVGTGTATVTHAVLGYRGGEHFVVLDGKPSEIRCAGIQAGSLRFAPQSDRLAYVARVHDGKDGPLRSTVVLDGVDGPRFDEVSNPVFSQDGQHLAYLARSKDRTLVVADGIPQPYGISQKELSGHLAFSPEDGRLAYAAQQGQSETVVLGTPVKGTWDKVLAGPSFGPDRALVWIASRGKQSCLVTLAPLLSWRQWVAWLRLEWQE